MRKKHLYFLMAVVTLFCFFNFNVSASSILPVKDAWLFEYAKVLSLTENGDLYYGESIYSQNKQLLLSNVENVISTETSSRAFALLNSGDIVKIITDYAFDKDNLDRNLKYFEKTNASKLLKISKGEECFFINNLGELMLLDQFNNVKKIYNNVKDYWRISDNEYILLLNENKLIKFNNGETTTILENVEYVKYAVESIVGSNSVFSALTQEKELYYFDCKNCLPTKIAKNVKTILSGYDIYIPYIDYENNLYVYDRKNFATTLMMENAKDGFYTSPFYYIIGMDNNLYVDKTNQYSDKYNPTIVQKDISEMVYSIDSRYFFNSTDGELLTGERNIGSYAYKWNISATGLSNIKSVKGVYHIVDTCKYTFVTDKGCVYGADYSTGIKEAIHTIYCQKPLRFLYNHKEIVLNLKVQNVNNRTMYPFRECLENFGATVLWDAVNNSAIGKLNGITIEFPIGKAEYYINGVKHEMDTTSYIDNSIGRTYIPIRFAAEGLGFTVDWTEGKTENTISIHK